MDKKSRPAAKPVRNATTAKGVNPSVIANFPNTGARPRNTAELKAAKIPAVCFVSNENSRFDRSIKEWMEEKVILLML